MALCFWIGVSFLFFDMNRVHIYGQPYCKLFHMPCKGFPVCYMFSRFGRVIYDYIITILSFIMAENSGHLCPDCVPIIDRKTYEGESKTDITATRFYGKRGTSTR